jgi:hypothetical protein
MPLGADRLGADDPATQTLARERTGLAWQRTALTLATIGGLMLGAAVRRGRAWLVAPAALLLALAAVVWSHGRRRAAGEGTTSARVLWRLTVAVTVAAVLAAVVGAQPP